MRRLSLLPSGPFYPTASELRIASECVAPWALGLEEVRETSEWAEYGRRMHALVERIANREPLQEYETPADYWAVASTRALLAEDLEASKPGSWHVEAGIKWRSDGFADEAELCERAPGERLRGWFSGTADLVYVRADGVLVVADWKFGPRERITGEPAAHSCQGFFLAVAFAALLEVSASSDNEVIARFERRMVSEQGIEVDGYDITQAELDDFRVMLGPEEYEIVQGKIVLRSSGDWNRKPHGKGWIHGLTAQIENAATVMPHRTAACGKCKAKAECPAQVALETHAMSEMVNVSTGQVEALVRPPQSHDDARTLYHAVTQGKHLTEEWERWLDAYVLTSGPVPIGLGLALKAIPSKDREVLDTPEALDVIERIAGPKAIEVVRKTGIGLIKAAARDGVDKSIKSAADRDKSKKAAEERIFAELIEAGAVLDKGKKLSVREVRTGEE